MVTDVTDLKAGDTIIIAAFESNLALGADRGSNRSAIAINKDGNVATFEEGTGVQIITLEAGTTDNAFAFNIGGKYLYAASKDSNHLKEKTDKDDNGSFLIEISETGVATIKAQGANTRNWLRFNGTNTPPIFSCYGSGQGDVAIYKLPNEGACAHESKTLVEDASKTFAATCAAAGQNTYVCDDCGEELTEPLAKLTHVVVNGACTRGCGVTVEEILEQAAALADKTTLDGTYTFTGVLHLLTPNTAHSIPTLL